MSLPEEPIYGNEDWQQIMDDEKRRVEEENAVNAYANAMVKRDKDAYDWIWEGEPRKITDAVIFKNRVFVEDFDPEQGWPA